MGAGGQNRGAHQRERNIVSGVAPVLPRLVSRPLTDAEDSLTPGAPDAPAHDGDGYNSCAFEEGSPPHEAPHRRLALVVHCHDALGINVRLRSKRIYIGKSKPLSPDGRPTGSYRSRHPAGDRLKW